MKRILLPTIFLGLSAILVGTSQPAMGQGVLDRLEQRIRDRAGDETKAGAPDSKTEGRRVVEARRAPTGTPGEPGYLGATVDDRNDRGRGVLVMEVRPGGPAEAAGLRAQDLITSAAGARVRQMSDLTAILNMFSAGDKVTMEVTRAGRREKVEVTMGQRPAAPLGSTPLPAVPPAEAVPGVPASPLRPADTTKPPSLPPLGRPLPGPLPSPSTEPVIPEPPGPSLVPPLGRAADDASRIEQMQRRIDQLERRVEELERALSAKKP
jgi:hypothetical protein